MSDIVRMLQNLQEPRILLRDTPEDMERLAAAIVSPAQEPNEIDRREARAIIERLKAVGE